MVWQSDGFSEDEWAIVQKQLENVRKFAEGIEPGNPIWSEITLETLEFLASLSPHIKARLAEGQYFPFSVECLRYFPFSVESPAPSVPHAGRETKIMCIDLDTFKAGHILGDSGYRPVLINFANECDAGGGWLSGMWGAQEECLMRRSSLYLSLWPLRRPGDELWRRSPPNRGPFGCWVPDLEGKRNTAYRQLGFGEGGERVVLPHLAGQTLNSEGKMEAERGDGRTDLSKNEEAMKILRRLDVPRSYSDERHGFPLTEAGVVYTPKLLVFRSPDQKSPDGRITGSQAYSPWMTSLCTCAALDLRPERGNQGAVYGYVPEGEPSKAYLEVTREKMRSVLYAAVQGGHDSVVLGALGCGVFANSPEVIAREWRKLLQPGAEFGDAFKVVVFAVTFSKKNFAGFAAQLGDLGPCCGDGSGSADHRDEFVQHLK